MNTLQQAVQAAQFKAARCKKEQHLEEAQRIEAQLEAMTIWVQDPDTRPNRSLYDHEVACIISTYNLDMNELSV